MDFRQYVRYNCKIKPVVEEELSAKMAHKLKQKRINKTKKKKLEYKLQMIENQLQYDPNRIPPDFQIAQQHRAANICGIEQKMRNYTYCKCCSRKVEKQLLNLNIDIDQFGFLGSGIPLFFKFHIYCIIFLIIILGSSGVYNIFSSYQYGQDCINSDQFNLLSKHEQEDVCLSTFSTSLSLGNKISNRQLLFYQENLNLLTIILIIFFLQIFRRTQRITEVQCDNSENDASDYTISVVNLPISDQIFDYDEDIKAYLQKSLDVKEKIKICSVNLVYKLQDYYNLINIKDEIIKKRQNALLYQQKYKQFPKNFSILQNRMEIEQVIQKIKEFENIFYEGQGSQFMRKYFACKAFISFQTETLKDEILEKYHKQKKNQLIYYDKEIYIQEARKPTDIFWENQHYDNRELNQKKIKISLTIAFYLIIIFFIILGLNYLNFYYEQKFIFNNVDQHEKEEVVQPDALAYYIQTIIQISIGMLIATLNYLLITICRQLTNSECCLTKTDHKISLAIKLTFIKFFNNTICNFVIQLWVVGGNRNNYANIFGTSGLVVTQHYFFASNAILTFIVDYIDPLYLLKNFYINKVELDGFSKCIHTQQQLNELYEKPEFNIDIRYAQILNLMFTVSFYAPIMPIAILYCIISQIAFYWLDKLRIIRRSSIKTSISKDLSIQMTEMLEFILPIFSISNIFFFYYILGTVSIQSMIGLLLGLIHAILPMHKVNKWFFKIDKPIPNDQDYLQSQYNFETDYGRSNPATSLKARKLFLQNMAKDELEFQNKIIQRSMVGKKKAKVCLKMIQELQLIKKVKKHKLEKQNASDLSSHSSSESNDSSSKKQKQKASNSSQSSNLRIQSTKSKQKGNFFKQENSKNSNDGSQSPQSQQEKQRCKSESNSQNLQSKSSLSLQSQQKKKQYKIQSYSESQESKKEKRIQKDEESDSSSRAQQSPQKQKKKKKIEMQSNSNSQLSQRSKNHEKEKKLKNDKESVSIISSYAKKEKEKNEQSVQFDSEKILIKKQQNNDLSFSQSGFKNQVEAASQLKQTKQIDNNQTSSIIKSNKNSEQSIKSQEQINNIQKSITQEQFDQINSTLTKNKSIIKLNTQKSIIASSNLQSKNDCQFIVSDQSENQNFQRYIDSYQNLNIISMYYSDENIEKSKLNSPQHLSNKNLI